MMKKTFFIAFFIMLNSFVIFSQNVVVKYKTTAIDVSKDDDLIFEVYDDVLTTSATKAIFKTFSRDTIYNGEHSSISQPRDTIGSLIFKDLVAKYTLEKGFSKKLGVIKDDNYTIKWTLQKDYKQILGYKTQLATGHFRGRDYKAYFCSELPYSNGPRRFDGLPGLILEVVSVDNVVKIFAKAIEFSKSNDEIVNPFEGLKQISRDEYKIQLKKYEAYLNNIKSDEGSSQIKFSDNKDFEVEK